MCYSLQAQDSRQAVGRNNRQLEISGPMELRLHTEGISGPRGSNGPRSAASTATMSGEPKHSGGPRNAASTGTPSAEESVAVHTEGISGLRDSSGPRTPASTATPSGGPRDSSGPCTAASTGTVSAEEIDPNEYLLIRRPSISRGTQVSSTTTVVPRQPRGKPPMSPKMGVGARSKIPKLKVERRPDEERRPIGEHRPVEPMGIAEGPPPYRPPTPGIGLEACAAVDDAPDTAGTDEEDVDMQKYYSFEYLKKKWDN